MDQVGYNNMRAMAMMSNHFNENKGMLSHEMATHADNSICEYEDCILNQNLLAS